MNALKQRLRRFSTVGPVIVHSEGHIEKRGYNYHIKPAMLELGINRQVTLEKVRAAAEIMGLRVTLHHENEGWFKRRVHADVESPNGNWGIVLYDVNKSRLKRRRVSVYSAEVEDNRHGELSSDQRKKIVDFLDAIAGKN